MNKMDFVGGINRIDTMLVASRNTINLLAEELTPEQCSILNGVVIHLFNAEELLDKMEEQFCSEEMVV